MLSFISSTVKKYRMIPIKDMINQLYFSYRKSFDFGSVVSLQKISSNANSWYSYKDHYYQEDDKLK